MVTFEWTNPLKMRTQRTVLLLLFMSSIVHSEVLAQEVPLDTMRRSSKNIFLVDAGALVTRYLNFGGTTYYPVSPYLFGYRRILGRNAVRVDVGGTFSSSSSTVNDSMDREDERNQYRIGLGGEHYFALGKRWLGYIGSNVYLDQFIAKYKYAYSTVDYREQRQERTELGVSALAGIAFRFNARMQLATETSYSIATFRTTNTDTSALYPQYNSRSTGSGVIGEFIPPTSLLFRVLF